MTVYCLQKLFPLPLKMDTTTTEVKIKTESIADQGYGDAVVEAKPAEVPVKPAAVTTPVETEPSKPVEAAPKKETELDKYWRPVKENPNDFTGWTYLLQFVDQEGDIETARLAYDSFLKTYPYCYGYWKKFADMEKRHNDLTKAVEVFERGVKAVPLSIDLWLHYINFYIKEFILEEETRKLYERAIKAAGTDFRSDKLWDNYIAWEKERDKKKVTGLFDRLLQIPTQLYSHHFDSFKKHILNHHPKEILSLDEFIKLRTEVVKDQMDSAPMAVDDAPPGDEQPPGVESVGGKGDAEEAMKVRDKVIKVREAMFKINEEEVSKRWTYEEGIKRPYFHVKPLERSQLKNWREYLDFEMVHGTHERIVILYERCMIATALYEDFWIKYAKYLEEYLQKTKKAMLENKSPPEMMKSMEESGLEAVRVVYRRACLGHLPKKPYIHMAWAAFEERHGKHSEALTILSNLEDVLPGMVMVAMRRISLERRIGDKEKTEMLFQEYIDKASELSVRAFYTIKYARYLFKVLGDEMKARKVINEALEKEPTNEKLYIQLLDMEYQKHPVVVESAMDIFSKAINNEQLSTHTKIKMSQRRLEFLEDFGSSILQLKECYDDHQRLLKEMQTEKKRKIPDAPTAEEPPEKKPKANGSSEQLSADYSAYWAQYNNAANYNYAWGSSGYTGNQYYGNS